jgi:hypothetical protein
MTLKKTLLAILILGAMMITAGGCKTSKGCDCPTFGGH